MATLLQQSTQELSPARFLWTRERYDHAIDAGIFASGPNIELIGGEIVQKMSPQKSPHANAVTAVLYALQDVFSSGFFVRVQMPLALSENSEPEPDIAVVKGNWKDYPKDHPSTAELVVEISDSTVGFDRGVKSDLYASAGIPEYWIVNLRSRVVEVCRQPANDPDSAYGARYSVVTTCTETESLSPLSAPHACISVADLIP